MDDTDLDAFARDLGFVLKSEQKEAVWSLLKGTGVFGVLPTGFGESLIFQLFVLANSRQLLWFVRSKANNIEPIVLVAMQNARDIINILLTSFSRSVL